MYQQSRVRKVDLTTGGVLLETTLPERRAFGEGLTDFGDNLYQLTWKSPVGYVYDKATLNLVRQFDTGLTDGWGLASDGERLFLTDSSPTLTVLKLPDLEPLYQVTIKDGSRKVKHLNEIEWVDGKLWGNIWFRNCLAKVEPTSGEVEGWADFRDLPKLAKANQPQDVVKNMDVMNGVAYNPHKDTFYLTGKYWPVLFEVELVKVEVSSYTQIQSARKNFIVPLDLKLY